jgi:tetratricopeptide (TPR) repeat protein
VRQVPSNLATPLSATQPPSAIRFPRARLRLVESTGRPTDPRQTPANGPSPTPPTNPTMATEPAPRDRGATTRRAVAALGRHKLPIIVFGTAFLVRFVYLVAYARSPFFQVHIADALFHEEWAQRILDGDIFSLRMDGVLYKPPLYPYFVALTHLAFGAGNFPLALLQVVMTASSCLLLYLIGRRTFGPWAAFAGALIYCFYFPSVYFATEMEIPALAVFLTLLSFYLLMLADKQLLLVSSAAVFGFSLLTLPTNILLSPLYALMLFRRQPTAGRGIRKIALFAAVTLATIIPCTVRNWIAGRHLTLISANGGINFYIGNNQKYDETTSLQPGYAFEELYDEPRRIAGAQSFADRDQYWYGKAFAFIAAQPGSEIALLLKKLVLYFADYEIFRNTDTYSAKASSIYRSVPFIPASLVLSTGLVGLFLAIRGRKASGLAAFCALEALPCLVFFVTDRYRLPSMGVWAIFSGFFLASLADLARQRNWRAGVTAFAGALSIAIISNLNLFVVKNPDYRPHFNLGFIYETQGKLDQALAEYSTALALLNRTPTPGKTKTESEIHARIGNAHMQLNRLGAARQAFDRAIAVDPDSAPAYSYLGTLYDREKRTDLAVAMFKRAIAINPWDVVSIHNLGLVYLNGGQLDQAALRFKRVIDLAPEHAGAHNNLAYVYGRQGRLDLMEAEAKQAVYYNPRDAPARYNLASLYLSSGRIEEAVAQYRSITQTAPRAASNAYNQLGVICAERNDLRQAIDNWQKALEIDPNNADALANVQRARAMMR